MAMRIADQLERFADQLEREWNATTKTGAERAKIAYYYATTAGRLLVSAGESGDFSGDEILGEIFAHAGQLHPEASQHNAAFLLVAQKWLPSRCLGYKWRGQDYIGSRLGPKYADIMRELAFVWKSEAGEGKTPPAEEIQARLSPRELAEKYSVPYGSLRKRLDRWRYDHDTGFIEVSNAAKNEPKFLYDESAVKPVIESLNVKSAGHKRAADVQQK